MKCLLFILNVCVYNRFLNGHAIQENENDATADEVSSLETEIVAMSDTEENNSNDTSQNQQFLPWNSIETDSSSSVQDQQSILSTDSSKESDEAKKKAAKERMKRFQSEMDAGDTADLIGQNPHTRQSHIYNDLSRRFVPQYKYTGEFKKNAEDHEDNELKPEKAPPELVLLVAKESALLGPDKKDEENDIDRKKILRTGDFWNGVWKDEVNVHSAARSNTQKKELGTVKVKIKPGSEFYKVVSRMKNISPRLIYIINKKKV